MKMKKISVKSQFNVKGLSNIESKHRYMIKEITDKYNTQSELKTEINNLTDAINKIDLNMPNYDLHLTIQRAEYLDTLKQLNDEYETITSKYNEIDYYDNVGDIIINYYELKDKKVENIEPKNILDLFSNNIQQKNDNNKFLLLEQFCKRIDSIKLSHEIGYDRIKICEDCNIETILDNSESAYICPCCGYMETIIIDEEKQFKEYSPYKRLNHFKEWLNQFQAKQTPEIPEYVFINIVKELNKNRITDLSLLNKQYMKLILKKLQYNNYYEHIAYIINKLNNLPPPRITRDMEKIFISMFIQIQEPWELYKHSSRKNFMSYSYVLHKFCELLNLDHLLDSFPLLKDIEKNIDNDILWYKICKYLNWEFICSSY